MSLFSTTHDLQFKVNIFKWSPLQLLFTVAFKEWWKLLNNVEYYTTYFSKHMHRMFESETSVFQIRWSADSCCVYWMLQMEREINAGRRLRKWRILKSAFCLNSSNLKANQIISDIILIAKKIYRSFPLENQTRPKQNNWVQGLCFLICVFAVSFLAEGCAASGVPNFCWSCWHLLPALLVYAVYQGSL